MTKKNRHAVIPRSSQIPRKPARSLYSSHHRAPTNMPERGSCTFFPRKEGEDPGQLPRTISINYDRLERLFHLPLREAACEVGLCPTTLKKACRSFGMERWPFRKGQSRNPLTRTAHTEGVMATMRKLQQSPDAPTLQATEVHQASPVRDTGASSEYFTRRTSSSSTVPFSRIASSDSTSSELRRSDSSGAVLSSVAPEGPAGLLQQTPPALDTRFCGEARRTGPAFQQQTSAPLDAPSYIDCLRGCVRIGVPIPEGQPSTGACVKGAAPPEAGPPRERSWFGAVMDYLDGPFAEDFAFMFVDEAGDVAGAPPTSPACLLPSPACHPPSPV